MVPANYTSAGIGITLALRIFYIDTFLHENIGLVHLYENASNCILRKNLSAKLDSELYESAIFLLSYRSQIYIESYFCKE